MTVFKAISAAVLAALTLAACTTTPVAQSPSGNATVVAGVTAAPPTVTMADHPTFGTMLVDGNGMTLYRYANDQAGVSNCYDQCAQNWPPLTGTGPVALDPVVPGTLSTITRKDGTMQVTYNGMPLYYFVRDVQSGDANGDRLNDLWYVIEPSDMSTMMPATMPSDMPSDMPAEMPATMPSDMPAEMP